MLHSIWFWVVIILAPIATVVGTLARLAKREPPMQLPPGVAPGTYRRFDDDPPEDEVAPYKDTPPRQP
ncbi:hypothetical protein OL229_18310 [Neisseriaceae bacterium JH1-16]|nr:hypothetical protein [Neisseriaceae bacterium JH1-16]